MNRKLLIISAALVAAANLMAQEPEKPVMTKDKDGTYTIWTESICTKEGFMGPTPLIVKVRNDSIIKVDAPRNNETPNYFYNVSKGMISKYKGMLFKDFDKVDAVSGATFSSEAVRANMQAAFDHYTKNR